MNDGEIDYMLDQMNRKKNPKTVPKKQIEGHCWECPNCGNTNPENWLCCVRCIKDRGKTPLLNLTAKEWESRIWRG